MRIIISFIFVTLFCVVVHAQTVSGSSIKSTIYTDNGSMSAIVYDNGLGDVIQEIGVGASPNGKDLITHHSYDSYRRETKKWLPVEGEGTNGEYTAISSIKSKSLNQYSDKYTYHESTYDETYIDKVSSSKRPGESFQNKKSTIAYDVVNGSSFSNYAGNITYSPSGKFFRTTSVDEDGDTIQQWTDKGGRTVAQITSTGETYFIYDHQGNISYIIPPALSEQIKNQYKSKGISIFSEKDDNVKKYAYIYHYDGMGHCIYKKIPGVDPVYYIYNKAGQCILTQDGNMRSRNEWMFTIPDIFGRISITGMCKNTFKYTEKPFQYTIVYARYAKSSEYKGYTIEGLSLTDARLLSVNYYDDYDFIGKYDIPANMKFVKENSAQSNGKGLLTGSVVACLDEKGISADQSICSAVYYDDRHNVIQIRSTNHKGGIDVTNNTYTFTGKISRTISTHTIGSITKTELYDYVYDKFAERLLNVVYNTANTTKGAKAIISNRYDNLGRLICTERNNNSRLKISFTYNIQSSVKSITTGPFRENIYYEDSYNGNTQKWNGGISAIEWKADETTRGYNYYYDKSDRLVSADYLENGTKNDKYSATYSYDGMGNITSLARNGLMRDNSFAMIDNLTYTYNGNQLIKVTDAVTQRTATGSMDFRDGVDMPEEYEYDANGNMTKDLNKGISDIKYNVLNLPAQVTYSNGVVVTYTYDATGRKLRTSHGSPRTNDSNAPFHTTEYCGNHIYDNGELKQTLFDGGYLTYNGETPIYHFYVRDHLGNNRMVLDESGNIEQVTHYYPYGLPFAEGRGKNIQPYKFNGKELDAEDGLNWMDYGARMYDGALARWNGVDALAEKNNSQSPYGYCVGNPVKYVDADGRDWLIYYKDNKGNVATYRFRGYTTSDMPNNRFVNQVITAYNYNVNNGGGDPSFNSATDSKHSISIVETDFIQEAQCSIVYWNPNVGIRYDSGQVGSPASCLDHEVDHAYDFVLNPTEHKNRDSKSDINYLTMEEKRVITGSEVKTARCNGEIKKNQVTRTNHNGYEVYVEGGVTSTKINIENTKSYHKRDIEQYETDY